MDGYQKPIFNPNAKSNIVKKVNNVETINVNDKVEVKDNVAVTPDPIWFGKLPFSVPAEDITEKAPTVNQIDYPKLTGDETLEAVVAAAAESAEENEDIEKIRDLQHKEYEDRDIAELTPEDAINDPTLPEGVVAAERSFQTDATGKPIFTKDASDPLPAADVDILHVDDLDEINDKKFKENFMKTTAKIHQISDEDAIGLLDVMTAYKKDKTMSVYNKLPEGIKNQVKQICMSANIPMSNANSVARMMLDQMIAETATDQTFIDFEKSINEAMKIPSMIDLYEEHVGETMSEKLPAMAEAIREEDPAKAQTLLDVGNQYEAARDYSKLRETFDTNTRIRKLMRRDYDKWKRFADELNFQNQNSKFRMPDATTLYPILTKVITNDEDNDIEDKYVKKFLVLLFASCANLHKDELVDAAYIYYLLKNISMLNYVNEQSAKTANAFSVELISNIKSLIYYIMAKEEEFYASNQSSGSRK